MQQLRLSQSTASIYHLDMTRWRHWSLCVTSVFIDVLIPCNVRRFRHQSLCVYVISHSVLTSSVTVLTSSVTLCLFVLLSSNGLWRHQFFGVYLRSCRALADQWTSRRCDWSGTSHTLVSTSAASLQLTVKRLNYDIVESWWKRRRQSWRRLTTLVI